MEAAQSITHPSVTFSPFSLFFFPYYKKKPKLTSDPTRGSLGTTCGVLALSLHAGVSQYHFVFVCLFISSLI